MDANSVAGLAAGRVRLPDLDGPYATRRVPWRPAALCCVGLITSLACVQARAWATVTRGSGPPSLHGSTNGRAPGYLGIEFHDAPASSASPLPATSPVRGVEVVMVDHDGPAGKAGLRPHDIIFSLNGQVIASAEALRRMIHDAGAGVQIALNVVRNGRSMTLNAQLADRDEVARAAMARLVARNTAPPELQPNPAADGDLPLTDPPDSPPTSASSPAAPTFMPPHSQGFLSSMLHTGNSMGLVLDAMEPQLASYFGAPQGLGLLVQSVAPGGLAAQAGLRAGDVVLRADMYSLHSQADWTKRLHAAKGSPVTLSILRERRELTLSLQTDAKHHSLLEWPELF